MLSELVPPAPLKPVQTTTGASAARDVEPPVTPLEPGPNAPSTAKSSTPSGLVPSSLDPQGLTRAANERPGRAEVMESVPKRARLNAVQFSGEELYHMDETPTLEFDDQAFDELGVCDQSFEGPSDYEEGTGDDAIPACLIHEFSEREPELEPAQLQELDNVAMADFMGSMCLKRSLDRCRSAASFQRVL